MSEIANFTTRCIAFVLPTTLDLAVRGLVGLNSHQGKMTRLRHSVRRSCTNFRLQALELSRSHSSYTQESLTRHDLALIVGERV